VVAERAAEWEAAPVVDWAAVARAAAWAAEGAVLGLADTAASRVGPAWRVVAAVERAVAERAAEMAVAERAVVERVAAEMAVVERAAEERVVERAAALAVATALAQRVVARVMAERRAVRRAVQRVVWSWPTEAACQTD